jgi:hypothetical protein
MKIKNLFKSRLKLEPGTRTTSFLFIATSIVIAAGILFAANMYYNIDTGEIVTEEIQRVTRVLRATAGLIVGGASNQNPASGYGFEVATSSLFSAGNVVLSAANQELRFTGGTGNYIGIKAPTTLSYTLTYTLPTSAPTAENYVLTSDTSGQLSWASVTGTGAIVQVGDALGIQTTGRVFTTSTGTQYGNTLWFHPNATYTMALTAADSGLTANATTVIPAVSGTNYLTVTPGALTPGQVLLATGNYTLGGNANLTWDSGNTALIVGASGTRGQLRLYSDNANYIAFTPTTSLASTVTYTWPAAPSVSGYVLSSDTSGNLSWVQAGDITAVGDCASGDCFTGTSGSTLWFKSGSYTGALTVAALTANATYTLPAVPAGTYYFTLATTTFPAGYIAFWSSSGNVITGSDTLVISGNSVLYRNQYPLAASGKQVLREMVPIFGFDLPVKTTTTTAVKISRDIVSYPLGPCENGTSRVHKFVIRYGSTGTSTLAVATSTNADYSSTTLPNTGATSTGSVVTAQLSIPTPAGACTGWTQGTDTTDWWVTIRLDQADTEIMIYQIFLAGYDELQ